MRQVVLLKKILIIDDDAFILKSFSQVLTKKGFEVETAQTGNQALEKLKQNHYDLALIDVRLPDIGGPEILLRAKNELAKTVKIMLTGAPSVETSDKSAIEGADTYIVKPIKIEELLAVINFFLRQNKEPA